MIRRFIIIIIRLLLFFRVRHHLFSGNGPPDGPLSLSQKELRRGCVVAFGSVRPSVLCLAGFVSALWKER